LWSFLAVAVVSRALTSGRWPRRAWLPVLFAVWANLHGGWIVGLGMIVLWAAAEIVAERRDAARWTLLIVACGLATLVTPYGWRLWQFLWQTVGLERRDITEWGPIWGTPVLNWVPWFVMVGGALWALTLRRWPAAVVLLALAYGSARVMRIESLFVTAGALLLAPALATVWPARPIDLTRHGSRYDPLVALVLLCVISAGSVVLGRRATACVAPIAGWAPDAVPVQRLARSTPGRLVTTFNWGEYALWHLGPRIKVSIDGRRETIYSDRHLEDNASIVSGEPAGLRTLAEWGAEYVWLPASSVATKTWLVHHGYRLDFESSNSFLAVRSDLSPLPGGSLSEASGTRCFPD